MQQNNLKHQLMKQFILLILILMSGMIPTWAQTVVADDIEQLQKQMYQLYNKNDETAFVDITNKLATVQGTLSEQYKFASYDAYQALKKLYFKYKGQTTADESVLDESSCHTLINPSSTISMTS